MSGKNLGEVHRDVPRAADRNRATLREKIHPADAVKRADDLLDFLYLGRQNGIEALADGVDVAGISFECFPLPARSLVRLPTFVSRWRPPDRAARLDQRSQSARVGDDLQFGTIVTAVPQSVLTLLERSHSTRPAEDQCNSIGLRTPHSFNQDTASSNGRATPCGTLRLIKSARNFSCASDSGALPRFSSNQ